MNAVLNTTYEIGDIVYHKLPESDPGVIVNIFYSFLTSKYSYVIALGFDKVEMTCLACELSNHKTFV